MPEEAIDRCKGVALAHSCCVSSVGASMAETAALRFVFDDESDAVAAACASACGLLGNRFSGESGVAAVITVSGSGGSNAHD